MLRRIPCPKIGGSDVWGFFRESLKSWKRLKGKNPEGKNFRKLLRRKQSSAKISKISRNTIKSSKSDIFYLLRKSSEISSANCFFLLRSLQKFLPFAFLPSGSFRKPLESLNSLEPSRRWTFLKRPLFQKTPFAEPERFKNEMLLLLAWRALLRQQGLLSDKTSHAGKWTSEEQSARIDTEYDRAKIPAYNGSDPTPPWKPESPNVSRPIIDDCQITHLICVCLKHLLYDFWGDVLGLLPVVFL